jgi:hypothetical protein
MNANAHLSPAHFDSLDARFEDPSLSLEGVCAAGFFLV